MAAAASRTRRISSRWSFDPFAWLKDVLSRIAVHRITRLTELLPHIGFRPG
ncbi:MAG: hypothetical protein DMG57_10910 [Acidobacteria bacterium]|nr:MAG: hypothetical protein DMG57_10910 [Acidobacteriota bacterium]